MRLKACLESIDSVAREIIKLLPDSAILLLDGDLASGKTTLVKSLAKAKGVTDEVTSPTFSLQHLYGDLIFHYDLYRVEFDELVALGIVDEFEKKGLHIIEWVEPKLESLLLEAGFEIIKVKIVPADDGCREYFVG
jgi:tRNA threonylcarbamoyladenosine biosynthesis protein TsaE